MRYNKSEYWVRGLMAGSLLLLLAVEGLWLYQEYTREEEEMKAEADRVFLDVVRGVEDSIMQEFVFAYRHIDSVQVLRADSVKFISIFGKDSLGEIGSHRTVNAKVKKQLHSLNQDRARKELPEGKTEVGKVGSISLFVNMVGEDTLKLPSWSAHEKLLGLLENRLNRESGSVPSLHVVNLTASDTLHFRGEFTQSYQDVASGVELAAIIPSRPSQIVGRMVPQILFSVLVFSSFVLAFGISLRNLQRQKRLAHIKDEFISNITHELKTPITTVGVALEALTNFSVKEDPVRVGEYLDISRQEVNRLSSMVNRILRLSLSEQKGLGLKVEEVEMGALIEEVLGTFTPQLDVREATVQVELGPRPVMLRGDKAHLKNVIYNLIDNALKYSPEKVDIRIGVVEQGHTCVLKIEDRGMGIPEVYQRRIFDKFFRVPSHENQGIRGYGLGLSYVYQVVEAHGGRIDLKSQPDVGTCFTLTIPLNHG